MQNRPPYYPDSPLPARVVPLRWEDLPSLVMRTAVQMHYRNPLWVIRPQEVEERIGTHNLCLLWMETDYQILQRLLALDEEALYQCTYHRFAPQLRLYKEHHEGKQSRLEAIHRPLLGYGSTSAYFQPYSAARACPYCFDKAIPYGRLYWNFRPLVICPQHNIFLIEQCPDCRKSIPLMRSSVTRCPHCKNGDYRRAQCIAANEGSFFHLGQNLIWHHLESMSVEQKDDFALLVGSPLLELPSWEYFRLLDVFLNILPRLFPDDPFLQVNPEIQKHLRRSGEIHGPFTFFEWIALTATFHYIFASWPNHFFAFLDDLVRSRRKEDPIGYESRDFGNLSRKIYHDLSEPVFSFLREAYENYLKTSYIGNSRIPAQERYSITITRTVQVLGIFQGEVDAFINQGLLRVAQEPIKVQNRTMKRRIERAGVERLCQEWKTLATFYKVSYSLFDARGDTMHILYKKGWLIPVRGPAIDGYPIEMYRTIDVNTFITGLLSRAVNAPYIAGESISLSTLSTSNIATIESILDAIFDGKLVPINTNTSAPLFRQLMLSHTQIYHWQDTQKAKSEGQIFLTREEVADVLGVRKHVVTHLVKNGLLIEEEGKDLLHSLFRWDRVETFRQTYVFSREAAALLDVFPAILYKYMNEGKIHPVLARITLLFRREDVRSLLLP